MITVGQAAYEKWREFINPPWANIAVQWELLPEVSKKSWEKIAQAAVDQQLRNRYQVVEK